MGSNKVTLKIECAPCKATGVFRGFAEPKGVGVICLHCDGTGCVKRIFNIFEKRQERTDIKTVRLSKGMFILNCGPAGSEITYEEFLNGEIPQI